MKKKIWEKIKHKLPMLLFVFLCYLPFMIANLVQTYMEEQSDVIYTCIGWITVVLYFVNFIYPFFLRKKDSTGKELLFISMIAKILLIPIFVLNFIVAMGSFVIPIPILFIFIVPIMFLLDVLLLILTSIYGINGLVVAYKAKKISTASLVIHIVLHIFFCFDVISAIYIFIKIKLKERKLKKQEKKKIEKEV